MRRQIPQSSVDMSMSKTRFGPEMVIFVGGCGGVRRPAAAAWAVLCGCLSVGQLCASCRGWYRFAGFARRIGLVGA